MQHGDITDEITECPETNCSDHVQGKLVKFVGLERKWKDILMLLGRHAVLQTCIDRSVEVFIVTLSSQVFFLGIGDAALACQEGQIRARFSSFGDNY